MRKETLYYKNHSAVLCFALSNGDSCFSSPILVCVNVLFSVTVIVTLFGGLTVVIVVILDAVVIMNSHLERDGPGNVLTLVVFFTLGGVLPDTVCSKWFAIAEGASELQLSFHVHRVHYQL